MVRKETIENDNSLVVISLSKVGEYELLQTLLPINLQSRIIILLFSQLKLIVSKVSNLETRKKCETNAWQQQSIERWKLEIDIESR